MEAVSEIGAKLVETMKNKTKPTQVPIKQTIDICKVCNEITLYKDENGIEHHQYCKCDERKKTIEEMEKYENLSKYRGDYALDTFDKFISRSNLEEEIKKKCLIYTKHFEKFKKHGLGMLFYGNVGSGKTFIANCIANEIKKQKHPILYFQLDDYVKEIKDGWDEKENKLLDLIKKVSLVVIDDWGIEKDLKEWKYTKLYNLINTIYLEKTPLIITTNSNLDELDTEENKRISDRFSSMCKPVLINFPSRRVGVAIKKFDELMEELS